MTNSGGFGSLQRIPNSTSCVMDARQTRNQHDQATCPTISGTKATCMLLNVCFAEHPPQT
ncbi:hypothetical protein A6X21_03980 [Planctopirus hydrillae]|uniref:Uncharacterized protein n=1 Tax=Planctopirus hydrillae TaxID=1841610 RepID=A0A1C3ENM0_9PLAN|nr:hypothetical protein A6X21_03980 [Planctopirus hydrillae]